MRNESTSKAKTNSTSRDAISPDMTSAFNVKQQAIETIGEKTMSTTTTTTTTKAATPKTPPKISHAKPKAPELPAISSVKLVPLALIDVRPQVRTVFDEASIQELADDIGARGLLQPVLLNPNGARFILIAGERRLRACKLLQLSDIPALITKASSGDALLMQLAENIQREDLDLGDQVKTVRLLHDTLQTVQAVADTVKKSKAWVSKRLALSHENLGWAAKRLMEDCVTEDVEILNTLSQLERLSYGKTVALEQELRQGTATRESARAMLKEAKNPTPATPNADQEERDPKREARRQEQQRENDARTKERRDGTGPLFIEHALHQLQNLCAKAADHGDDATAYLNSLHENQCAVLLAYLQQYQVSAKTWNFTEWAKALTPYDSDATYLELFVALMAVKGEDLDNLYALVTIMEQANRFEEEETATAKKAAS